MHFTTCQRKSFALLEFLLHRFFLIFPDFCLSCTCFHTSKAHVISIIFARFTIQSYFRLFTWLCALLCIQMQAYMYMHLDSFVHPFLSDHACLQISTYFWGFFEKKSSLVFSHKFAAQVYTTPECFKWYAGGSRQWKKNEWATRKIVILFPFRSKLFFVCHHCFCCSFFIRLYSYPHGNQDLYLHCMLYSSKR